MTGMYTTLYHKTPYNMQFNIIKLIEMHSMQWRHSLTENLNLSPVEKFVTDSEDSILVLRLKDEFLLFDIAIIATANSP